MANSILKFIKSGTQKGAKAINKMDMLNIGMTGYFGYQAYKESKAAGSGTIGSLAAAAGEVIKDEMLGFGGVIALGALRAAPKAAAQGINTIQKLSRESARNRYGNSTPFYNATFRDTQQAYTMRQAGMQLAENSKYNLQQSLMGNEAAMLHM